MQRTILFILVFLVLNAALVTAGDTLPEPQRVELAAEDGLVMVGDFYTVPDAAGELPTVVLMHQSDNSRVAWKSFIPVLLANGYNALAIDLRGFGETKGERSLEQSKADTQLWFDWLRGQPAVKDDRLAVIGASVSSGLALVTCAADVACVTVISLSPVDVPTGIDEAMTDLLKDRSVLLIASQKDSTLPAASIAKTLAQEATGEVALYLMSGGAHGMSYVNRHSKSRAYFEDLIVTWLDAHMLAAETG
jgi:dienelactone hydrolase